MKMIEENNQNRAVDTEVLSGDERNISRLLGNLKRVVAPKDFDFRLKARLATGKAADYRPARLIPILRYAFPLSLLLFVGSFVMLNYPSGSGDVPEVATVALEPAVILPNSGESPTFSIGETGKPVQVAEQIEPPAPGDQNNIQFAADVKPKPRSIPRAAAANSNSLVGRSVDQAFTGKHEVILPRNMNAAVSTDKPKDFNTGSQFGVREALSTMGIEAEFAESAWKVKSVAKGGLGERSGIRAGDLMEAIDDRPIDDKTVYAGSFSAKTFRIKRENQTLQIDLKPK